MKKAFKIIGSSVLVIFLLLITIPFLYQKQINETVKTYLNDSVNAQIEFEAVNLSLLSSFPQANVTVENLNIINNAPFEGASLASVKSISFDMSVTELFKSENDGPMVVTSIAVESAVITIKLRACDGGGGSGRTRRRRSDSDIPTCDQRSIKSAISWR